MRVCLVSAEYPPHQGGVGDYTRELARALAHRGVDATVVTGGAPDPADAAGPAPVERCISSWGWRSWGELERAMGRLSPHVVHIQYQAAAYGLHPAINLWPRFSRWRGATAVTFHDLRVPYLFPKAGGLRYRCVLELARSVGRAVVTNVEDHAALAPRLARPPVLIPIGSNIHPTPPQGYDRAAWRAQAGLPEGATVLAYFGFLNESKGGEDLVEALGMLRRQGVSAFLWLIGGEVGTSDPTNVAYLERVRGKIAELGLGPYVRWTGYMPPAEVSANLLAADLAVFPYRDGVSFRRGSLMAALAHGLPVVSTRPRLPLPELVEGENMALVPPGDVAALAARIAALASDAVARGRLGEGAQRLAELFGWDAIAARTVEVYDALV